MIVDGIRKLTQEENVPVLGFGPALREFRPEPVARYMNLRAFDEQT